MAFYLVLILLIPFQTHPLLTANIFGFTVIKWVGLAALIAAILKRSSANRATLLSSRQGKLFLLFCGFVVTSWFLEGQWNAFSSLLIFLSFFVFYFVTIRMVTSQQKAQFVLWAIVVCMFLSSLYTIKEFIVFGKYYSISGYFRPNGTFGDPNYFSLSAIMTLPMIYYLYKSSSQFLLRVFLLGIAGFDIIAIALSTSRGAFVGLVVMLLTILYLSEKKFKTLILFIMMISVLLVAAPNRILDRIGGTKIAVDESVVGDVASTTRRWYLIVAGLKMISAHPLTGVGLGQYKVQSLNYYPELGDPGVAHNTYVELAAELGLPAFFVFMGIIFHTFRDLAWLRHHYRKDSNIFLLFTMLIVSLMGYVASATFLSGYNTKIFWLIVFFTITYRQNITQSVPVSTQD